MIEAMMPASDDEAALLFRRGERIRRAGRHAEAASIFRQALAVDPHHAPSLHRLGNAYKAMRRWPDAERAYRRAVRLDGGNVELLRQLANVVKDLGRSEEAEPICRRALALAPEDATLHLAQAVILLEASRYRKARAALAMTIAVRPDHAPALVLRGILSKDEGRSADAVVLFRRALALDPQFDKLFHRIGAAWRELGDIGRALAAQQRALALDPCDGEALHEFGNTLLRLGVIDAADAAYRRGMAADPDFAELKAAMSIVAFRRAENERALSLWFEALGLTEEPPSAPALNAGAAARRLPAAPSPIAGPVTVATSLMPVRVEAQRTALGSWRAFGLDVISVNSALEIEQLRPLFPEVRFETAARTAEEICGRPLVPLDEMLDALGRCGSPVVGIVNSDIVLAGPPETGTSLAARAQGGLVFGSRLNVASLADGEGWLYEGGYDYFLFDRCALETLSGSGMVIGAPWWDYWVPLAAALAGVAIHQPCDLRALHCAHDVGYSRQLHLHFGRVLITAVDRLAEGLAAAPAHPQAAHLMRGLSALAAAFRAGTWDLSPRTASHLGRLVVDTIVTVAQRTTVSASPTGQRAC